nr:hypothetical protein [Tanacetum cinerariifolium]
MPIEHVADEVVNEDMDDSLERTTTITASLEVEQDRVCACARYQVNPKVSHLHVVKRIFSDHARASLDRKSTTGGCQVLGCRLISWQCKKQTMVVNSITKAEYVAASSCYGQIAHHQLLNQEDDPFELLLLSRTDWD